MKFAILIAVAIVTEGASAINIKQKGPDHMLDTEGAGNDADLWNQLAAVDPKDMADEDI